ncbi:MAG: sodium:solute symporter, partial [Oscillospiraceae bacterium]|nr:sodium:solute symporter [Oscillospiraceae bacterium]
LRDNGGLNAAIETLATGANGGWQYASFFGADPTSLLFVVLLTSLGTWGLPQMVGKFYAIKNEDAVKKGTVISTLFAIVVAGGCYFLGGFGRLYSVDVAAEGFDAVIPQMLSTLSPVIIGVVIVLVLSASMSTLSSLVLTSSSTITLDLIAPLSGREMTEKRKMLLMRIFIAVFIAISAAIAIKQASDRSLFIAQMMGVSWGALAGAFLAPFLYGLYSRRISRAAVCVSFVWGVGLETVQLLISMGAISVSGSALLSFVFRNSLYSGVFAMVGGLIIVPIVSELTGRSRPANTDEVFACYDRTMNVDITEHLGR